MQSQNQNAMDESTQNNNDQLNVQSPIYVSETLRKIALPAADKPSQSNACATCPGSIWFTSVEAKKAKNGTMLKCYCKPMGAMTWETTAKAEITACDAREQEIAKLIAEMTKQ